MKQPERGKESVSAALLERRLRRDSATMGILVGEEAARAMVAFLLAILEVNREVNLTRITDPLEALRLHVLDSLCAAEELSAAQDGPVLDLGSGAGFPGVPLAVQTGRTVVLLDSIAKKMAAVGAALERAGLEGVASTQTDRAETLAVSHRGAFGAVVARAVGPLGMVLELAIPLTKRGGRIIIMKGTPSSEEIASGMRVSEIVGAELRGSRAFRLPGREESRTILSFEAVRDPSVALPRRVGMAQRRPMG